MPVSMKGTSMTRYYEKERFSQRLRHAPKLPNSSLFRHRRHHRMHGTRSEKDAAQPENSSHDIAKSDMLAAEPKKKQRGAS